MKHILGFSGKRESGKTTAARYIQEQLAVAYESQPEIFGFFDTAKQWYRRGMRLPKDIDWSSQAVKDAPLPNGKTHCDGLVLFGTTYCRSLNPDWWINVWGSIVDELDEGLILVPDVRFTNELEASQQRGGHVIRFLRAPHADDTNETETALDRVEQDTISIQASQETHGDCVGWTGKIDPDEYGMWFDAVIDNETMAIDAMRETVLRLVQECKWV